MHLIKKGNENPWLIQRLKLFIIQWCMDDNIRFIIFISKYIVRSYVLSLYLSIFFQLKAALKCLKSHALLNKRLDLQYLLYRPSKSNGFSEKFQISQSAFFCKGDNLIFARKFIYITRKLSFHGICAKLAVGSLQD